MSYCSGREQCSHTGLCNSGQDLVCTVTGGQAQLPIRWQALVLLPGGSDTKESACNAGDLGPTPGSGRSLGEGMAVHSSILAWRILWTEEPGGLQSMGSPRVGHD